MKALRNAVDYVRLIWRSDRALRWILGLYAGTQLSAIGWDLPGSFSWENDGVAPRDLFGGLAYNLTPGDGHRYPLFHYLILAAVSLPILLPAAFTSDSWSMPDLMPRVLSVPVMTGVAILAKLVSVVMGLVTVLVVARMACRLFSPAAGRWAAAFAVSCLSVAYYGRTTNLDGPYLMWTALALDRLLTAAEGGSRRDWTLLGVFGGLAVATKDQAAACFVLWLPLVLLLPRWGGVTRAQRHWQGLGRASVVGLLTLGLAGGGLLNPTGFAKRVRDLLGPSSGDWRQYEASISGLVANLRDLAASQAEFWWPWPVVALAWLGVPLVFDRTPGLGRRLLPLLTGLSSLIFFTLPVARSEHRFLLPLGLWLSVYGGAACAELIRRFRRRSLITAALTVLLAWAAGRTLVVHLTQWGDARREVASWLSKLPQGSRVETYGLLVYLPHCDTSAEAPYRVTRVGPDRPDRRNPLLGAEELQATYGGVRDRGPAVLVIPEGFAIRFMSESRISTSGRAASQVRQRAQADEDARAFFRAAVADQLPGYRLAFEATANLPAWLRALGIKPVVVHGSTGRRVWVLVREDRAQW